MRKQRIYVSRTIEAHQWAVWTLVADVTTWTDWGPFDVAELETSGAPHPQGAGAVRRFRTGKRTTRELVTTSDAPRALTYRLLSGVPVRGYEATVSLQATSQGTVVAWSSSFRPLIPGTGGAIRHRLEQFIVELLEGLAAKLEARAEPAMPPQPTSDRRRVTSERRFPSRPGGSPHRRDDGSIPPLDGKAAS